MNECCPLIYSPDHYPPDGEVWRAKGYFQSLGPVFLGEPPPQTSTSTSLHTGIRVISRMCCLFYWGVTIYCVFEKRVDKWSCYITVSGNGELRFSSDNVRLHMVITSVLHDTHFGLAMRVPALGSLLFLG